MESATYDQGLALELANHLDAPCLSISELKAEHLYMAVRQASDELKRSENQ
jgi:magnesium chelatase subunit D